LERYIQASRLQEKYAGITIDGEKDDFEDIVKKIIAIL
jgi:hypothetical protein